MRTLGLEWPAADHQASRRTALGSEHDVLHRRLRNYQLMFRGALACLVLSTVMTGVGVLLAIVYGQGTWLAFGLLMFVWSVGCAYLMVDSTVRVMEVETEGHGPRSK